MSDLFPTWSTACPDWEERIVARQSLVPFAPLFSDQAEAGLEIIRGLRMVELAGRPRFDAVALPWAYDLPRALFGAYDADSGRRLIRFFFEFVAKKNGKSTKAAGVMLAALLRNWRESGEFLILAPTKEIADNSFIPARDMVRADDTLRALLHIQENWRTITHRRTGATLKVVAADSETVGGKKTIGLLIDELWLFGKRAGAEGMIREAQGGLASRPEGFVIYLSTQSDDPPAGVFAQKLEEFRAIRDGEIVDPRSLPILYEFPSRLVESGEYRDRRFFYIPNPNLGASVDEEFIADELAKAERAGRASLTNFEAKHLNIQVGMSQRVDSWAGSIVWDRGVDAELRDLDRLLDRSEVATVGIDGGGLDDLLGVSVIGRERGTRRWLAWNHALVSDIGMERRKANADHYDRFEAEGTLTKFKYERLVDAVDDLLLLPINIRFCVDLVAKIKDRGLLAQVGVDAAGIGAIVDALAGIGVTQDAETLDAVRQGIALMGAIKSIEIKLADYSFKHGGTALMQWAVGNLRVVPTPTAMRLDRSESGFGKVDPAVAMFNAAHLMALNPEPVRKPAFQLLIA